MKPRFFLLSALIVGTTVATMTACTGAGINRSAAGSAGASLCFANQTGHPLALEPTTVVGSVYVQAGRSYCFRNLMYPAYAMVVDQATKNENLLFVVKVDPEGDAVAEVNGQGVTIPLTGRANSPGYSFSRGNDGRLITTLTEVQQRKDE